MLSDDRISLNRQLVLFTAVCITGLFLLVFFIPYSAGNLSGQSGLGLGAGIFCSVSGFICAMAAYIKLGEFPKEPIEIPMGRGLSRAELMGNEIRIIGPNPLIGRKVRIELDGEKSGNRRSPRVIVGIVRREILDTQGYSYELIEGMSPYDESEESVQRYLIAPDAGEVELDALLKEMNGTDVPIFVADISDLPETPAEPFDSGKMGFVRSGHLTMS